MAALRARPGQIGVRGQERSHPRHVACGQRSLCLVKARIHVHAPVQQNTVVFVARSAAALVIPDWPSADHP